MRAMAVEQPQVSTAAHRIFRNLREFIHRILLWIDEIAHNGVDLGRLKARDINVEIALRKQNRELT
jgi:hypothetical protein